MGSFLLIVWERSYFENAEKIVLTGAFCFFRLLLCQIQHKKLWHFGPIKLCKFESSNWIYDWRNKTGNYEELCFRKLSKSSSLKNLLLFRPVKISYRYLIWDPCGSLRSWWKNDWNVTSRKSSARKNRQFFLYRAVLAVQSKLFMGTMGNSQQY